MTDEQRKCQMGAVHATYARMIRDGELPVLHPNPREGVHLWATEILGRLVPSLKTLSDFELNSLRDRLNGKDSKLLTRVRAEFARLGIGRPDAWVAKCAENVPFSAWREKTLDQLPVSQLYRLLKMLERRSPGKRVVSQVCGPYNARGVHRFEIPLNGEEAPNG